MVDDADTPRAAAAARITVGEDLARLSVAELESRLDALRREITRIESELSARGGVRAAAEALFQIRTPPGTT